MSDKKRVGTSNTSTPAPKAGKPKTRSGSALAPAGSQQVPPVSTPTITIEPRISIEVPTDTGHINMITRDLLVPPSVPTSNKVPSSLACSKFARGKQGTIDNVAYWLVERRAYNSFTVVPRALFDNDNQATLKGLRKEYTKYFSSLEQYQRTYADATATRWVPELSDEIQRISQSFDTKIPASLRKLWIGLSNTTASSRMGFQGEPDNWLGTLKLELSQLVTITNDALQLFFLPNTTIPFRLKELSYRGLFDRLLQIFLHDADAGIHSILEQTLHLSRNTFWDSFPPLQAQSPDAAFNDFKNLIAEHHALMKEELRVFDAFAGNEEFGAVTNALSSAIAHASASVLPTAWVNMRLNPRAPQVAIPHQPKRAICDCITVVEFRPNPAFNPNRDLQTKLTELRQKLLQDFSLVRLTNEQVKKASATSSTRTSTPKAPKTKNGLWNQSIGRKVDTAEPRDIFGSSLGQVEKLYQQVSLLDPEARSEVPLVASPEPSEQTSPLHPPTEVKVPIVLSSEPPTSPPTEVEVPPSKSPKTYEARFPGDDNPPLLPKGEMWLILPVLIAEYKRDADGTFDIQGTNQLRIYLQSAVEYLRVLGVTGTMVFGLITEGVWCAITAAWYDAVAAKTCFLERNAQVYNLCLPEDIIKLANFMCWLRYHHIPTLLSSLTEKSLDDFAENIKANGTTHSNKWSEWTQLHQFPSSSEPLQSTGDAKAGQADHQ